MEPEQQKQWVEELAAQHGRMVLAAAQRVLGSFEDAEDVLQGVFLRLLDGQVPRDGVRDWGALLRVMATHAAIDQLRRRGKARREDSEVLEVLPDSSIPSPAEAAERRRLASLLRDALAQLPEREAEAFALHHFEELSYQEIALHQGSTAGQIGVMLHRARKRLRKFLEPLLAPSAARKE